MLQQSPSTSSPKKRQSKKLNQVKKSSGGKSDDDELFGSPSAPAHPMKQAKTGSGPTESRPGDRSNRGLLQGRRPSDVSASELKDIVQKAKSSTDLWGELSSSEAIEKIFEWFGKPSIDVPWFYKRGSSMERTIIPSEHNRELQDIVPVTVSDCYLLNCLPLLNC